MSKHKQYVVTLVMSGSIDPKLHFEPFSRDWWVLRHNDIITEEKFLYPIRLNMKTLTIINNCDFIITVVEENSEHLVQPGYVCKCKKISNEFILQQVKQ